MKKVEILTGKQEVDNYPYGRLKTTKFYELEFNPKKGFRSVGTTINPKTGRVNKPKKSTYSKFIFMYKENETGHIKYAHFSPNSLDGFRKMLEVIIFQNVKLTTEEKEYLFGMIIGYYKVAATARIQYTYNTFNMKTETPQRQEDIKLIHQNAQKVFKYLFETWNFDKVVKVYKDMGTVKQMFDAMPKDFEKGTQEIDVVKYLKSNKTTETKTNKMADKKTTAKKTVKKAAKKATKKAVAKKKKEKKTTLKGGKAKGTSLKELKSSGQPNKVVLYGVTVMKKIISDNAKGKDVKKIKKSLSNAMSGIKQGLLKETDIKVLKAHGNKLKGVVSGLSERKYKKEMKTFFDELTAKYPQPTRKAKKEVIDASLFNF